MEKLVLIWSLVRRDYALQFAGSFLGISWMLLQNLALITVYALVFLVFQWRREGSEADYTAYILSGLLFWIPLQEYLVRGTGILTDNRSLLKRSQLGADTFLWIPFVQYCIHCFITSLPVFGLLYWNQSVSLVSCLVGLGWLLVVGLYLLLFLHYLSRLNVLLKDISPLVRLVTSLLFWAIPILYYPTESLKSWNLWNPFTIPLDIFRSLLLSSFEPHFSWNGIVYFLGVFLFIFTFSRTKLQSIITDHF